MSDLDGGLGGLLERAKGLASGFAMYSALGSFILYLLGYLALRFHLTVLGVATDLAVLDERYLFAGANCLVYLASSLPIAVLVAAVVAGLAYGPYRLLRAHAPAVMRGWLERFSASRVGPTVLGIVVALGFIQILMRKCFVFANLLVKDGLPDDAPWLNALLADDRYMPLYFSGLILGTALTGALLMLPPASSEAKPQPPRVLRGLLGTLFLIQILLLPVNFGVLVYSKSLPRVTAVGKRPLASGDRAWLAWDGKNSVTYFVKRGQGERSLISVGHEAIKDAEIEVTGYDPLSTLLPKKTATGKDVHADADR